MGSCPYHPLQHHCEPVRGFTLTQAVEASQPEVLLAPHFALSRIVSDVRGEAAVDASQGLREPGRLLRQSSMVRLPPRRASLAEGGDGRLPISFAVTATAG